MNETVAEETIETESRVHVLEERNMRWYFGTQLFSLTGMMLRQSVLSLLIIDLVGVKDAPPLIGMVWALNVLPGALIGIFAGMIVDHYDKRKILWVTAILGVVQGLLLVTITRGSDIHHIPDSIAIWKIMAIMLFTGITNSIDGICRNAIVKDAVVNHYNNRMAGVFFSSLYTIGMILGNGLAGWLVLWIGYSNTFVINSLSFLILIFGLSQMCFKHLEEKPKTSKKVFDGAWQKIKLGAQYSFSEKGIRICILLAAAVTVFGFAYNVILSVIAKDMFQSGKTGYSYLAATAGAGSLLGSITAVLWSERRPKMFIVVGCILTGLAHIAFALTTNINHAAVCVFFCGAGFMSAFLPLRGAILHIVDTKMIGMVLGITFTFFYAGMVLSSVVAGYVAKHYSCPAVLMSCGIILLTLGITTPFMPGIEEIEEDNHRKADNKPS
jgi:MFS family permease